VKIVTYGLELIYVLLHPILLDNSRQFMQIRERKARKERREHRSNQSFVTTEFCKDVRVAKIGDDFVDSHHICVDSDDELFFFRLANLFLYKAGVVNFGLVFICESLSVQCIVHVSQRYAENFQIGLLINFINFFHNQFDIHGLKRLINKNKILSYKNTFYKILLSHFRVLSKI
jgi:hypothetical protein